MLVVQLCLIFCDPVDYSLPGSSVHGILQARILERVTISFSRGSSWPRGQTWFCCIGRQILYHLNQQGSPVSLEGRPEDCFSVLWFPRRNRRTQKLLNSLLNFILTKGYRLKSTKGPGSLGKVQEKPAQAPKCPVSSVPWTHLISPAMIVITHAGYCQPVRFPWVLVSRAFIRAQSQAWWGSHGNSLQYSCLEKYPWTEEPGVSKSWTRLSAKHRAQHRHDAPLRLTSAT